MLDLLWDMVDHPRSAVDGCCYVLKFCLYPYRIYSFGDSVIFRFAHFGWKTAYSLPLQLLGGFKGMFP